MERDCKGVAFERQRCHPWKRPLGAPCPWSCNVGLGTIPRMSSAVVEIRTHCPAEVETRILEAVHASIVDSFKVLPVYRTSRRRCASPAALRGTPVAQRPNARPMAASTCRRTGPCRPSASGTGSWVRTCRHWVLRAPACWSGCMNCRPRRPVYAVASRNV